MTVGKAAASAPIGIFDSGIGGLTVATAIKKLLPNESIIYFGDTAHLPYGDKSPDSIKYYSIRIADFLMEKGCKAIVIACNTASAHAFQVVKKHAKGKIPVFNVIDPVAEYLSSQHLKEVGVIATKGTIKSGIYEQKIMELSKNTKVNSLATPLLAPMIEEGFFNNKISKSVIKSYLDNKRFKKIEALVLGCTHYPLIKNEIKTVLSKNVEIIDSSEIIAQYVKDNFQAENLINTNKTKKTDYFYVSDLTEAFTESTKLFFHEKIKLKLLPLWENE